MTIRLATASAGRKDSTADPARVTEQRERTPWLLAFLCLLIPALPSFVVLGPLKSYGSPARAIAVLLFGLSVLGFILIRRAASTRTMRPGIVLIVLFFLLQLTVFGVGLGNSDNWLMQASASRVLFGILAFTGVALGVMTRIQTPRQRAILLGCLAIGLTFACVTGLLQTADIDLRFLFKPPGFIENFEDYREFHVRAGVRRVWGTSVHPIEFSILAAVAVLLTIHFARYAANRQVRWLAAFACVVALVALPQSVSRTGVVALAVGLLVYMWNVKVRNLAFIVIGAAAGGLAYIAAFPATANAMWQTIVSAEQDSSITFRTDDYARVGESFRAHPIFGLGLGRNVSTQYDYALDNEWLSQLVQGGIFSVTAMAIVAVGGIFGLSAALRTASTPRERDQAYVIGAIFVAILSASVSNDLFYCQQASLILFISFGMLWSNFKIPFPEVVETARPSAHRALAPAQLD